MLMAPARHTVGGEIGSSLLACFGIVYIKLEEWLLLLQDWVLVQAPFKPSVLRCWAVGPMLTPVQF